MHWIRECFTKILRMKLEDIGLEVIYDVAHNIGKIETYEIDGVNKKVFIHRKGATRAFPPGHPEIPSSHRKVGQAIILPGSMGTASYLLVGTEAAKETFYSTAHGAGRVQSRSGALRSLRGEQVKADLEKRGILVKAASWKVIAEEAPQVYKEIDEVAKVSDEAGIGKKVVRLVPLGVIKG
jgi:tRNA-splicing ligase RtcB